jgi:hypothetical protein
VSFAAITLCAASQQVFIIVVYFVIDSIRKLLDTPSYSSCCVCAPLFDVYIILCVFSLSLRFSVCL